MASNLKAQLEKCIGDLDGKGEFQIIEVTEASEGDDHWLVHAKLANITESIKLLVCAEDEGYRIRLQARFDLPVSDLLDKTRCLDVINQVNLQPERATKVMLAETESGLEIIVCITLGYHPFYLGEDVLDDMVPLFRMNILALIIECAGVVTALEPVLERRGKLHS